jgi:hypothetical protein
MAVRPNPFRRIGGTPFGHVKRGYASLLRSRYR